jgi:hypothetical protein
MDGIIVERRCITRTKDRRQLYGVDNNARFVLAVDGYSFRLIYRSRWCAVRINYNAIAFGMFQ